MTSKIKQTLCTAAAGAMLAALLAAPAQAAAPHLTPDSTVAELHGNEGIVGSGFDSWDRGTLLPEQPWEYPRWSLRRYIGAPVDDAVAALNLVIDNYNQGVRVTYPLYTAEEIAADPTRASAELYYFPAKQPGARYALVLSGNMMERTARVKEGCSAVAQLHEMGYAAFILNYRVGRELKDNANYQDLVRAVQYITAHAGELQVDPEDYALMGFSSGGQKLRPAQARRAAAGLPHPELRLRQAHPVLPLRRGQAGGSSGPGGLLLQHRDPGGGHGGFPRHLPLVRQERQQPERDVPPVAEPGRQQPERDVPPVAEPGPGRGAGTLRRAPPAGDL